MSEQEGAIIGCCLDCKWWSRRPDKRLGSCDLVLTDEFELVLGQPTLAIARTTGTVDYGKGRRLASAWLETDPTFGCIQWKQREVTF